MTGRTCEHVHEYVWEQRWRRDPREIAHQSAVDRELSLLRQEQAAAGSEALTRPTQWLGARFVELGERLVRAGTRLGGYASPVETGSRTTPATRA